MKKLMKLLCLSALVTGMTFGVKAEDEDPRETAESSTPLAMHNPYASTPTEGKRPYTPKTGIVQGCVFSVEGLSMFLMGRSAE